MFEGFETFDVALGSVTIHGVRGAWGGGGPIKSHPEALPAYERAFGDPAHRHAMIEDYRAAATIDLAHDRESAARGVRIRVPALVLWGDQGLVGGSPASPLDVWREQMADGVPVEGRAIEGAGHFLVEDAPDATLAVLEPFLRQG